MTCKSLRDRRYAAVLVPSTETQCEGAMSSSHHHTFKLPQLHEESFCSTVRHHAPFGSFKLHAHAVQKQVESLRASGD